MSADRPRHEIATRRVAYEVATDGITVDHNVPYELGRKDGLALDIYYPARAPHEPAAPALLFVTGYPDDGLQRVLGCGAKDMESYVSWARLAAANGIVAITYQNRTPEDVHAVLRYVQDHAGALGIDARRIGVWSCSGNVPTALSILMTEPGALMCAVLCYGFMLDLDGARDVADGARTFRFANPCEGRRVEDLPPDVPLFIARAGRDETPGLNASLDAFISRALALNRPVTLVNHHTGPHAFDLCDDGEISRAIVRQILAFLRVHLGVDRDPQSHARRTALPD